MKARVNLTINEMINNVKRAHINKMEAFLNWIKRYFKNMVKPKTKKKNILQLVDELKKTSIDPQQI